MTMAKQQIYRQKIVRKPINKEQSKTQNMPEHPLLTNGMFGQNTRVKGQPLGHKEVVFLQLLLGVGVITTGFNFYSSMGALVSLLLLITGVCLVGGALWFMFLRKGAWILNMVVLGIFEIMLFLLFLNNFADQMIIGNIIGFLVLLSIPVALHVSLYKMRFLVEKMQELIVFRESLKGKTNSGE